LVANGSNIGRADRMLVGKFNDLRDATGATLLQILLIIVVLA
jgi:hypothetical protein